MKKRVVYFKRHPFFFCHFEKNVISFGKMVSYMYLCNIKMSAKRGWSTYWLLFFTFDTPRKVVCHACIFLLETPRAKNKAQ